MSDAHGANHERSTRSSTPRIALPSRWLLIFWRLVGWGFLVVSTTLAAHGIERRILAAVLMTLAAVITQFISENFPVRARGVAVVLATAFGLAATIAAPSGLGEVPAYVCAFRLPFSLTTTAGRWFVALDTVAVGAVVGVVSHSLVGALAGLGIPLLAQRSEERHQLIAERDRAQALLVEVQAGREAEAQAAALQERGRIARDLHDTLAHSLAGLSVQLQGIRAVAARAGSGPEVLEPLDRAAALARDGLVEARAAVTALRDPIGLGLAEIPMLVGRHPDVALTVAGDPRDVAPEVGHALYRVVQEALTNAARYAPGATVTVAQSWQPDLLTVRIDDVGGRAAVPDKGTGLGLAGMSERIEAVAGTLTAGPRPDGGWCVEARVPA